MSRYTLRWKRSALKELEKLPKITIANASIGILIRMFANELV
nr:hypothetical protein [Endozoicomonas sp.]